MVMMRLAKNRVRDHLPLPCHIRTVGGYARAAAKNELVLPHDKRLDALCAPDTVNRAARGARGQLAEVCVGWTPGAPVTVQDGAIRSHGKDIAARGW